MATINIKNLPENTVPADTDVLHTSQSNLDKKLLLSTLKTFFQGLFTSASAAMATDEIVVGADTNRGIKKSGIGIASGAAAGMVLVSTVTANNSATVDFALDTSKYEAFLLIGSQIVAQTNATIPLIRFSVASTYDATAGHYGSRSFRWTSAAGSAVGGNDIGTATAIVPMDSETMGTGANQQCDFHMFITSPAGPRTRVHGMCDGLWASGAYVTSSFAGAFLYGSSAKDGVRFLASSGNIVSGKFYLYGYRKA